MKAPRGRALLLAALCALAAPCAAQVADRAKEEAAAERRLATLRDGGALRDIAPTILDLLGMPRPDAMSGRSLLHASGAATG